MNRTITAISVAVIVSGCSVFGGSSAPTCPVADEGVRCLSAREVYAKTHTADTVAPNRDKDGNPIGSTPPEKSSFLSSLFGSDTPGQAATAEEENPSLRAIAPAPVMAMPAVDKPLPVRTQAKVMRIWIAPWEDEGRDLVVGGYVFSEIEGRAWTLGEEQIARVRAQAIDPLAPPKKATARANLQFGALPVAPANQQVGGVRGEQFPVDSTTGTSK